MPLNGQTHRAPSVSPVPMLGDIWGRPGPHLICFPSLRDHCPSFPDGRMSPETHFVYSARGFVFGFLFSSPCPSSCCLRPEVNPVPVSPSRPEAEVPFHLELRLHTEFI